MKNEARALINKVTRRIKEELGGKEKRVELMNIANSTQELDDAINSADESNIKQSLERLKNANTKAF